MRTDFTCPIFMTANSRKSTNRVRIIGGEWRSRVLHFADVPDIRPTPDRVRETLFNWLQYKITGARCLDLFAGSGVLGFEALSRGASSVTAVELNPKAAAAIRANSQLLETHKLALVQASATDWLQHRETTIFDIVFLDPPFDAGLHETCCHILQDRGWLAPGGLVYLEAATPLANFSLPPAWTLLREKRAGDVHYGLCQSAA